MKTWHELVPRDVRKNVEFRLKVLRRCKEDREFRRGIEEMCRRDLLFCVNLFVWQFNPKEQGAAQKVAPFVTWRFQDRALLKMLWCVEEGKDILIEKSRQMGASWMLVILFLWLFLFRTDQSLLFISRNEPMVDSDKPTSLFWKIDYMLRLMPDFLKPEIERKKLYFGNPRMNSYLYGEASTGKAAVGGTLTAMGIDEFSQIGDDHEVLHRTSDSTNCRIFNGTHKGLDTAFYELSQRENIEKLVMHWSEHPWYGRGLYRFQDGKIQVVGKGYAFPPDYDFVMEDRPSGGPFPGLRSPWYDLQCERKGSDHAIAMDLDIDPGGSKSQLFDAVMIRRLRGNCRSAEWVGDVVCKYAGEKAELSQRGEGHLSLWLTPLYGGEMPKARYVIACDVSQGAGASPSVATIFRAATGEKVGEYSNALVEPTDFAVLVVGLCKLFLDENGRSAFLGWERPGPGLNFGKAVMDLGFRNVYYFRDELKLSREYADVPGWRNDNRTSLVLLLEYKNALKTGRFYNPSELALKECLSFHFDKDGYPKHDMVNVDSNPAGAKINHGDHVIADALAWKLSGEVYLAKPVATDEGEKLEVGGLGWRQLLAKQRAGATSW